MNTDSSSSAGNYISLGNEGLLGFWCRRHSEAEPEKGSIARPNDQTGPRGREQT